MILYTILLTEILLVAFLIIGLYRLKSKISLVPLFIFIGSNQYTQHVLSTTLYFKIFNQYSVSTGSVILFTSSLFAILLIFIKEGVPQTRTLIIGIVLSNITLTILGAITALQIDAMREVTQAVGVPLDFFRINYRLFLVGTITLVLDSFLLVILYQFFVTKAKIFGLFGGIVSSLLTVLWVDSILFSLGSFYGNPRLGNILVSQLIGKTFSGLAFSVVLYLFLRFGYGPNAEPADVGAEKSADVFSILTYRRRNIPLETESTHLEQQLTNQLVSTLEVIKEGFVSLDENWCYRYVNERAEAMLERKSGKLIGKNIWKVFPDLIGTAFYENCNLAAATGNQVVFEDQMGSESNWYLLKAVPAKSGVSIFFDDITESIRAKAEIEKEQRRNEALLNALPDLIFVVDRNGVFRDSHEPAERKALIERGSLIGKSIKDVLPEDLALECIENIEAALDDRDVLDHFYELNYPDQTRSFEARYIKNSDFDVLVVVRDITEETRIRAALKESEMKYRALIDQASDGILVHNLDGAILDFNKAAAMHSGYSIEEFSKFGIADLLFTEDLAELPIPYDRLKNGESTFTRRRIKRKDGSALVMDISSRMNDEGNVIAIARDVSERLAIDKEIIESENRFRSLTENAPIGIFQADLNGEFVYVNQPLLEITGLKYGESMGYGWTSAVAPEDRERVRRQWQHTVESDGHFMSGFRWKKPDGSITFSSVRAVPLRNNEELFGFIGTIADITDQKRAEEELALYREELERLVEERTAALEIETIKAKSADRLKSAFLATMSHELRTPLNSIIGFTGILINEIAGPLTEEQKKQLLMVKNSGRHLLSLINDILDLSKIEAGEMAVVKTEYDLRKSIFNTIALMKPQAETKGIALSYELPPNMPKIVSDERRIEQVLINLVDNAVKFTETGKVTVRCEVTENVIITKVIDTGIGIRNEDIKKLFVPFSQIDSGLTRNHQGTGLGLSISQKLIKILGGTISVESEYKKGSIFTVILPRESAGS
ncbi:MAG: PAS domain S-box protein [Pyrinomonadaceae bacterium]|nr:PAS domain S-box protein [Pyrinomonadaceae bacterium]